MDKKTTLKLVIVIVTFLALGYGYMFFQEQSLLSSGRESSDVVIQMLNDGDVIGVKSRLSDFAGSDVADNSVYLALSRNLDYLSNLIVSGQQLNFIDGQLGEDQGFTIYSGVYSITVPQGGDNYLSVIMRHNQGKWTLTNTMFGATNPLNL